jgi:hypothetical protein
VNLDEVADELYGLSPDQFTKARDEWASEARKSGDKDLASQIKALRRPTASAWLANALARHRPDEITRLTDLGAAMRRAQSELDGTALRELMGRRRQLVATLADEAKSLAVEAGLETSESSLRELTVTLESATVDEQASDSLTGGHLTTVLTYSGLESALASGLASATAQPRPDARSPKAAETAKKRPQTAPDRRSSKPAAPSPTSKAVASAKAGNEGNEETRAQRAEAQSLLKEARAAAGAAERELARQQSLLDRARTDRARIASQLNELQRQLSNIEAQQQKAERAEVAALKAIDVATASLRSRAEAAKQAETVLARLKDSSEKSKGGGR